MAVIYRSLIIFAGIYVDHWYMACSRWFMSNSRMGIVFLRGTLVFGIFICFIMMAACQQDIQESQQTCTSVPGIPGVPGAAGVPGIPGSQGQNGDTGQQGQRGEPGQKGMSGDKGSEGPRGPASQSGKAGPIGPKGERGIMGPPGQKGDRTVQQLQKSAFSVVLTNFDGKISLTDPVKYNIVLSNVGNDYNQTTGIFTCRIPGTYVFSFMAMKSVEEDSETASLLLMLNGIYQLGVHCDRKNRYSTSTNIGILNLSIGDEVWIQSRHGYLFGNEYRYTSFSGFLLYPE